MRRPISSKSDTCTESVAVDAAGISGKVGAHYPGRSVSLPWATDIESVGRGWQKSADGIVRLLDQAEGLNVIYSEELEFR
jgi:hypothetical protein